MMETRVELRVKGKLSDGYEYDEEFNNEAFKDATDEELTDYVKKMYKDFNDSEDEENQRTLIGIIKVVIVEKTTKLF